MNKDFIPYEQALELKELGFDEPCFGWFTFGYLRIGSIVEDKHVQGDGELLAPTFSQTFRWFREKYGLYGISQEWTLDKFSYQIKSNREGAMTFKVYGGYPLIFKTYEEAELECLKKLIKIVKDEIQTNQ